MSSQVNKITIKEFTPTYLRNDPRYAKLTIETPNKEIFSYESDDKGTLPATTFELKNPFNNSDDLSIKLNAFDRIESLYFTIRPRSLEPDNTGNVTLNIMQSSPFICFHCISI